LGGRTIPVRLLSHRQALDHCHHHVIPSFSPIDQTATHLRIRSPGASRHPLPSGRKGHSHRTIGKSRSYDLRDFRAGKFSLHPTVEQLWVIVHQSRGLSPLGSWAIEPRGFGATSPCQELASKGDRLVAAHELQRSAVEVQWCTSHRVYPEWAHYFLPQQPGGGCPTNPVTLSLRLIAPPAVAPVYTRRRQNHRSGQPHLECPKTRPYHLLSGNPATSPSQQ
jgi:hypothetical protein